MIFRSEKNDRQLNSVLSNTAPAPRPATALTRLVVAVCVAFFFTLSAFAGESLRSSSGQSGQSAQIAEDTPDAPLIELDGSISVSPDGSELAYRWTQVSGPRVRLSDPNAARPQFRTNTPGTYEFRLVVSSNGLDSEPYIVRLEIERENLPPVAKVNLTEIWGRVGQEMQVDGSASFDPEGELLSYRWRVVTPGLSIPDAALRKPVLVVEPGTDGLFEVELTVSDGDKTSAPVRTRLGVKPRPVPPVAQARIVTVTIPAGASATSPRGMPGADLAAMAAPRVADGASLRPGADPAPVIKVTDPARRAAPAAPTAQATQVNTRPPPAPFPGLSPDSSLTPPPDLAPLPAIAPEPSSPPPAPPAPLAPPQNAAPRLAPPPDPQTLQTRLPPTHMPPQPPMPPGMAPGMPPGMPPPERNSPMNKSLLTRAPREKTPVEKFLELPFADALPPPVQAGIPASSSAGPGASAAVVPIAVVVAPTHAQAGSLVKMDATQSFDPGGNRLVYRWRQTGGPRVTTYVMDERLGNAAPGFEPREPGLYSFSVTVYNGATSSDPIDIDINVSPAPFVTPPSPVNASPDAGRRADPGLHRVPELTPLPNSQPAPTRFPRPRFENARERPAAKVLLDGRR